MSSSDEEAEIYGIENGFNNPNGDEDVENTGLSRRDRRAAKRDQKKWDERKEREAEEDENGDEDGEEDQEEFQSDN